MEIISWFLSAILIQNVVLSRFLGTCPFLGVSKNKDSALGMGLAVTFVMTISSVISYLIYNFILVKYEIDFMKTIVFILVIASLVQIIEMIIRKFSKKLYDSLGIYLPLITTNCAVLGMSQIVIDPSFSFFKALIYSFASGIGFLLVLLVFSSIRSRIDNAPILKSFNGIPIALICAGLMALIISRFSGVI